MAIHFIYFWKKICKTFNPFFLWNFGWNWIINLFKLSIFSYDFYVLFIILLLWRIRISPCPFLRKSRHSSEICTRSFVHSSTRACHFCPWKLPRQTPGYTLIWVVIKQRFHWDLSETCIHTQTILGVNVWSEIDKKCVSL